jgi:hypothetical protein
MLYKLNNTGLLSDFYIPEYEKSILFNYCKLNFNQYLSKFNVNESEKIISFLVVALYIFKNGLNIETTENDTDIFLKQISMNNDRNFLAIINLILPYLDDKNNKFNQNNITGLNHIIETLNPNNKTKFCNFIYDHNFIKKIDYDDKSKIKTIRFHADNNTLQSDELNDITNFYYNSIFYFILDIFNRIRYKFYINWVNTFPLTLNTYKNSKLYNASFNLDSDTNLIQFKSNDEILILNFPNYFLNNDGITNENLVDINKITNITNESQTYVKSLIENSKNIVTNYKGINLEDIYNSIVNDYYFSIKRNKWLLFEFSDGDNIKILIQMLNDIFNIDTIINEKSWFMLNNEEQQAFFKKWNSLKEAIKKKEMFIYSYDNLKNIFVSIVSYFEIHYTNIVQLIKDKTYEKLTYNLDEEDDEDMFDININDKVQVKNNTLDIIKYLDAIKNVPIEHIYNFLYSEINDIKITPYNFILFNNNKFIEIQYKKIDLNNIEVYELTPKNYYNYAKSLIYKNFTSKYKDDNILLFSRLWDGLSIEDRYIIAIRLNQNDNQNWFKITGVLKKIGYTNNLKSYQDIIYNKIRSQIIDLTFENLIRKGCINIFEYNPTISDSIILSDNYETKKKKLAENMKKYVLTREKIEEYSEAYYYVNNKQYKEQSPISIKHDGTNKILNYMEYLSELEITANIGGDWITSYAVDWVSQIDFYMKFINQRVMYVTGATGQGKSTQVPKLYLYGLKSLLYKNNGKIVCTVPRIDPVLENATRISGSMGLNIEHYNDHFKEDVRTLEGTIQYKYKGNDHINVNTSYYLRIITDGTLIMQLTQNPLLKDKKTLEGKYKLTKDTKISNKNVYDIIMVDEAHEHNKNMDLILTLMKYSLFYNNDIKLSIISATMEDDEPIFRRFYRFIDDNLIFPLNTYNLNYGVDRNLIDRRYHISPPGTTTQHNIEEFYEIGNNEDTYDVNEKLAIERVKNIFTSTSYGEILLFSVTVAKLTNLVEILNNEIPPNCVAIPYHGKMSEKYKAVAKKAHINIKEITVDRRDIDTVFNGTLKEENARIVNAGTYTRACIIATNAAEASLTISSLKFVVDIGFEFSVKYNYSTKENDLVTQKITEASRIQRKGRVGRVSDGTVYHMYRKHAREPVKAAYDISITDFSDNFKDLLTTNNNRDNEIISGDIMYKLLSLKQMSSGDISGLNTASKIIYDQYKLSKDYYREDGTCGFIDYRLNIINNENIYKYYFPSYFTGYSISNLLDTSGHFYIISPLEQMIDRDINTGNIIDKNGNYIYIDDNTIKKIYENAELRLDIIRLSDENDIYKSDMINEFDDIKNIIKDDDNIYTKLISLSLFMNSSEEGTLIFAVIFIFKILTNIQFDISRLIESNRMLNPYFFAHKKLINENKTEFYKLHKVNNSELELFYKIFIEVFNIIDIDKFTEKMDEENDNISENLIKFLINNELNVKNITEFCKIYNFDSSRYDEIIKLILKGDISIKGINDDKNVYIKNIVSNDMLKENNTLKEYCKLHNFNFDIVVNSFSSALSEFLFFADQLKENKFTNSLDNLQKILKISIPEDDIQKIKLISLFCYTNNIFYIKNGKFFSLLSSEELQKDTSESLLPNISSLGFFLQKNSAFDSDGIQIISNISKSDILNISPFIVKYINGKGQEFLNYKDIENNVSIITKKYSNFTIKIDDQLNNDNNISNILMSQIIDKPSIMNKIGGGYYNIGPIQRIMKLKMESVKKLPDLVEYINKSKAVIDQYQYAYVISLNSDVVGFFLVKEIAYRTIFIYKIFDDVNSYYSLYQKLSREGYIIYNYKKN